MYIVLNFETKLTTLRKPFQYFKPKVFSSEKNQCTDL